MSSSQHRARVILHNLREMESDAAVQYAQEWSAEELEALRSQGEAGQALLQLLESLRSGPGGRLRSVLESSVGAAPQIRAVTGSEDRVDPPTFKSGFPPLDAHGKGFCGITSIAGETGVGKSMWAAAAGVEAALAGWRVVYFNVELDASTFLSYFGNYCTTEAQWKACREQTCWWFCDPGTTLETIVQRATQSIADEDEKALIVIDSIDSFSESTSDRGGHNQFVEQRRWLFWAMQCRRMTEGNIAFILLGERNADGYLKGRKGAFTADNVVSIAYAKTDGHFHIRQEKGRYCGRADYGEVYLDHETSQYKGVIQGGDEEV